MKAAPLLATVVALCINAVSPAQEKPNTSAADHVARIHKLLDEIKIDTKDFQTEMPLAKFLAALEAKLPKEAKLTVRLDEPAFGTELPHFAGAKVKFSSSDGSHTLRDLISLAIAQAALANEMDFGIRPEGIVLTRPRLAAHTANYDVRDLIERPELLRSFTRDDGSDYSRELRNAGAIEALLYVLTDTLRLKRWESIQVLNGTQIALHASLAHQQHAADLFDQLRRRADVGIYMNARLYEVDRAFFAKHVESLLAVDKQSGKRPMVVPIDGPRLKPIVQQKLLLESDEVKIWPGRKATFLSSHQTFRFNAGSRAGEPNRPIIGTGQTGFSLDVVPIISADRRFLRLRISQNVAKLAAIEKRSKRDPDSGKEWEVESPRIDSLTTQGTIQISDGTPILITVDGGGDKVRVVVALPVIWIEREMAERFKGKKPPRPREYAWSGDIAAIEIPPPLAPPRLELTPDVKQLLQALITEVLTSKEPFLKNTREFYGTAKDKTLALVDGENTGWPKDFKPDTHGLQIVKPDPFDHPRRVLGIRLDKFDLKETTRNEYGGPIEVCMFNAGGRANGAVIGGCFLYYAPKRVGNRWTVEFLGGWDP